MPDDFDISRIDDVIHSRVRLGVMAIILGAGPTSFTALKDRLDVTQGTLSVHLRKLEEARYIVIDKRFVDRRPLTEVRLTPAGEAAFRSYIEAIGKLAEL